MNKHRKVYSKHDYCPKTGYWECTDTTRECVVEHCDIMKGELFGEIVNTHESSVIEWTYTGKPLFYADLTREELNNDGGDINNEDKKD